MFNEAEIMDRDEFEPCEGCDGEGVHYSPRMGWLCDHCASPFEAVKPEPCERFNEAEILRDAATVLEEHGWCRGVLKNDEGCYCAQGALTAALVGDTDLDAEQLEQVLINNREAIAALSQWVLTAAGAKKNIALWVHNDHEARNAQDVIGSMRRAADAVDTANGRYLDGDK